MRKFISIAVSIIMMATVFIIPGGATTTSEAAVKAAFNVKLMDDSNKSFTSKVYTGEDFTALVKDAVQVKHNNKTTKTSDDILVPEKVTVTTIEEETVPASGSDGIENGDGEGTEVEATEPEVVTSTKTEEICPYEVSITPEQVKGVGSYTVKVTGKDLTTYDSVEGLPSKLPKNMSSITGTVTFTVEAIDMSGAEVTVEEVDRPYTGEAYEPDPTVIFKGTTLIKDQDYTVKYTGNKSPGTATVTVTGKGIYKGSAKTTFEVESLGELRDLDVAEYGQKTIKIAWGKVEGATGYKVSQKNGSKWTVKKKKQTATNYTFTKLKAGTDYTFKVATLGLSSNITKEITVPTTPAKVAVKSTKDYPDGIKLTWDTVTADKYEIEVATDSSFNNVIATYTTEKGTTSAKTFKVDDYNLETGSTYYFRVRAINSAVNGDKTDTQYGTWSDVKSCKKVNDSGFTSDEMSYYVDGEMITDAEVYIDENGKLKTSGTAREKYYFDEDGVLAGYSKEMWEEIVHYAEDGVGYESCNFKNMPRREKVKGKYVIKGATRGYQREVKAGQPIWSYTDYLIVLHRTDCMLCVYKKDKTSAKAIENGVKYKDTFDNSNGEVENENEDKPASQQATVEDHQKIMSYEWKLIGRWPIVTGGANKLGKKNGDGEKMDWGDQTSLTVKTDVSKEEEAAIRAHKPKGSAVAGAKYTDGKKLLHFGENHGYSCWYCTQWYASGAIFFHSLLFQKGSKTKYKVSRASQFNGSGKGRNSNGCVRMDIGNALWIYNNIKEGTRVYSYN